MIIKMVLLASLVLLVVYIVRKPWEYWVGSNPEHKVMGIKTFKIPLTRWELHVHKMIAADLPGCFHSHPARAMRLVIFGGYREELWDPHGGYVSGVKDWWPWQFGWVEPDHVHRISMLFRPLKGSYSLWLRAPITHPVELHGPGWKR
jgi:hypothetical protein